MPFRIVRNDIIKMQVDAIVNTANPSPVIGRGTDWAVYAAAGKDQLLAERIRIGRIARGQAAITPAFALQARYIIHTVGPEWEDGTQGEAELLRSCYENSLRLAKEYQCESIAFPLISTGVYGFPKDLALQIVIGVVSRFLLEEEMMIYLVVFDEKATRLSEHLFEEIESCIDDDYVHSKRQVEYGSEADESWEERESFPLESMPLEKPVWGSAMAPQAARPSKRKLQDLVQQSDETFQQMLLRLISEKGMTNAQAYKKANQDKKLFSKIKKDVDYQPKKKTAMAFALALELNLDEAKDLLARAGYAFSPSNPFDKVIRYCIETKEYNIYEVEIILYDLGLGTLCNY